MQLKKILRNGLIILTCFAASTTMYNYEYIYNNMKENPEVKEFHRKYGIENPSTISDYIEPEIKETVDDNRYHATVGLSSFLLTASSLVLLILTREEKSKYE